MSLVTHDYRCHDKLLKNDYRLVKYSDGNLKLYINGVHFEDFDKDIYGNVRAGAFDETLHAWHSNVNDYYILDVVLEPNI